MADRDLGVDIVATIGAVASDGGYRPIDLVEQGTDLRAIVGILVGQHRGDDPAGVGVRRKMQHSPGPAPFGAMLLGQPLARAAELQPRAVHQQVHRRAPRLVVAPPASQPGGSRSSGPAPGDRDRAAEGWTRSTPRSGAAPSGTRLATSAPWRSPDRSRRVAHPGWCMALPPRP